MPRCVLFVVAGLVAAPFTADAHAGAKRPNIVIFLSDDVGYGEYGFQGCKDIPTPHIDSIARNGIRFTQGYVSGPYCSPTRAGLMTGRYQTRFGHEFNGQSPGFGLPLTEQTIAELLKSLGYATCCVGKWHLGLEPQFRPTKRGFDEFYGTLANTPFFKPKNFVDSRISNEVREIEDPNFYTTDAYAARAVDWLAKHKDGPWFLYLPFNAQHAPLEATEKYLKRFAGIQDEKRRIFAGMMSAMDDAVGRVLEQISKMGQNENTIIIFLADNGGPTSQTTSSNGPLRGFKATTSEGGVRVPFCIQWKGTLPAGKDYHHPIIQLDLLPTCLAAAGGKVTPRAKLDGVNLLPYLTGDIATRPHETLYWRFGEQWAIRHGDMKLVASKVDDLKPRLIDLAKDIGEANDLSASTPEKMKELKAIYEAWNAEQEKPRWQPNPNKPKAKKKNKDKKQQAALLIEDELQAPSKAARTLRAPLSAERTRRVDVAYLGR